MRQTGREYRPAAASRPGAAGELAAVLGCFSVDGTLIQAWASQKSFRRKDGGDEPPGPGRNGEKDFKGEKRSNATHASTTDPDARQSCLNLAAASLRHIAGTQWSTRKI